MRILDITLFKTPLDPNYNNVIDINDLDNTLQKNELKSYLYSHLIENYKYEIINPPNIKSVKIDSNKSFITLPISYFELREYNYCVIAEENPIKPEHRFFFITDIKSENDNIIKPSSSLTLVWDSWSNNIDKFNFDHNYSIEVGHESRFVVENNKIIPKLHERIDLKLPSVKSGNDLGQFITSGNRYIVLYMILEVADYEDFKITLLKNGATDTSNLLNSVAIENRTRKNILYCPVAILDTYNNTFKQGHFRSNDLVAYEDVSIIAYNANEIEIDVNYPLGGSISDGIASSNIMKAWYSFFSPYTYDIEDINDGEEINITFKKCALGEIDLNKTDASKTPVVFIPKTTVYDVDVDKEINFFKHLSFYNMGAIYNNNYDISLFNNKQYKNHILDEPIKYNYPLKYLTVDLNGNQNIIDSDDDNLINSFKIKYMLPNVQPLITYFINNKLIKNLNGEFSSSNGIITKSIDALDDYLIRNGSQEQTSRTLAKMTASLNQNKAATSMITSSMKSVGNLFSGDIVGATSNAGSAINSSYDYELAKLSSFAADVTYLSKHKDLDNSPPIYNSNTGENDCIFQDRPIITLNTVSENNVIYKQIISSRKMYGESFIRYKSPFINTRVYFDFIKTNNIKLLDSINNNDKIVLESALNRGIFKNHITIYENDKIFNKNFDKINVNNYETEFITNPIFN